MDNSGLKLTKKAKFGASKRFQKCHHRINVRNLSCKIHKIPPKYIMKGSNYTDFTEMLIAYYWRIK